jgi:hypothetical protein
LQERRSLGWIANTIDSPLSMIKRQIFSMFSSPG